MAKKENIEYTEFKAAQKKYIETVKNNLRAFLFTQNFYIDTNAGFYRTVENDNTHYLPCTKLEDSLRTKANKENKACLSKLNNKLNKLLSDKTTHIDIYYINEICDCYKFPVEKILSSNAISREEAIEIMEKRGAQKSVDERFAPLSKELHKSYFGEFYGYTFVHDRRRDDNSILKFKLSISTDAYNNPVAKYTFFTWGTKEHVFTGTPYYIAKTETIFISMATEDNERYQYLYFHGMPHKAPVIYKSGVCVRTCSTYSPKEPDVKSFIITPFEIPDELVSALVPGILKMTGKEFYILASNLEKLKAENASIRDFHEKYASCFELIDNAVYSVDESLLFQFCKDTKSQIFAFEQLSKIKQFSLSPNRIIHPDTNAELSFFESISPSAD